MSASLLPCREHMEMHLRLVSGIHLGASLDAAIEISWSLPKNKGPSKSRHFPLNQIGEAAQFAYQINSIEGQNVYFVAPVKLGLTGRSSDGDILAVVAARADLDTLESNLAAEKNYQHYPPTVAVITGRTPHLRQQLWWQFSEPSYDFAAVRQLHEDIARILGGDPQVVNPGRLMRLAGSIAHPKKKDRVAELTELVLLNEVANA